jgi:hypothetical protein
LTRKLSVFLARFSCAASAGGHHGYSNRAVTGSLSTCAAGSARWREPVLSKRHRTNGVPAQHRWQLQPECALFYYISPIGLKPRTWWWQSTTVPITAQQRDVNWAKL